MKLFNKTVHPAPGRIWGVITAALAALSFFAATSDAQAGKTPWPWDEDDTPDSTHTACLVQPRTIELASSWSAVLESRMQSEAFLSADGQRQGAVSADIRRCVAPECEATRIG